MKNLLLCCLMAFFLFNAENICAQVGIGTTSPHSSASLDITSTMSGLLMPRLTIEQRDAITLPATGLMIYNRTTNDGEINTGTEEAPNWIGIKTSEHASQAIQSVTAGDDVNSSSTESVLVPGMSISPLPGTYLILFNAQVSKNETTFSTQQGITDLNAIYNQLINMPSTNNHALVFGSGEILEPGVYNVLGAASINGILTLDGGGDPNALFVIRSSGALSTGAGTEVILTNGADASNIFWVAEGAVSTAATTIMKGTLFAHDAAASLGANTNLEGRMFSTAGTITMGASSYLKAPEGPSPINLGVLSTFVIFTEAGAISGCSDCAIIGDVGTGAGATTSFDSIDGTVYAPGITVVPNATTTTYSVYVNEIEVANSSRDYKLPSSNMTLQSMVTVIAGDIVQVRWKVDAGNSATINYRVYSMIRSY